MNHNIDERDMIISKKAKIIIAVIVSIFIFIGIFGIIYDKKIVIDQYLTKAVYEYKDITLKNLKELGFESCNLEDEEKKIFISCSNEIENEGAKEYI